MNERYQIGYTSDGVLYQSEGVYWRLDVYRKFILERVFY